MSVPEGLQAVQYLVDAQGNRRATVVEMVVWEDTLALLENAERSHILRTVALLDALQAHFGPAVAGVVDQAVERQVRAQWAAIADRQPSHTPEDLIRLLWEPLRAQGFEFTARREGDEVQVRCTRCPMAEIAREIGAEQWLYHLYCAPDPPLVAAFNPRMGFRRTKTLMEGDDGCDHTYFMGE